MNKVDRVKKKNVLFLRMRGDIFSRLEQEGRNLSLDFEGVLAICLPQTWSCIKKDQSLYKIQYF